MTLIIGYGNDLRGYDRFGIDLANSLNPYFDTIIAHQLTLELVEKIKYYDTIIFADVSYGTPHGAIASAIKDSVDYLSHKISIFDFISFANSYHNKEYDFVLYSLLSNKYEYDMDIDSTYIESIKNHIIATYR